VRGTVRDASNTDKYGWLTKLVSGPHIPLLWLTHTVQGFVALQICTWLLQTLHSAGWSNSENGLL